MSAWLDRENKMGFYYGNALKDLAHELPPEENDFNTLSQSDLLVSLMDELSQLEAKLSLVNDRNSELSFFLKDLNRFLN